MNEKKIQEIKNKACNAICRAGNHKDCRDCPIWLEEGCSLDQLQELFQEHVENKDDEIDGINIKDPLPELKGTFPIVLYFGTEKDCDEFKNIILKVKPNLVTKKL